MGILLGIESDSVKRNTVLSSPSSDQILIKITVPWPEIEKRYAELFTNRKGNVAKPLRLALGACIIQAEYGYSDEETALQIQENPYLAAIPVTIDAARNISGAGIYSVVMLSGEDASGIGMLRAAFIIFPINGPTIIGISTLNTILTP